MLCIKNKCIFYGVKFKTIKRTGNRFYLKTTTSSDYVYIIPNKIVIKGNIKHIKREMGILDRINNRNIIKIYDHFDINENEYYLVLEYVPNGTLDDKINNQRKSKTPFQEIEIIRIFKQIINGIIYLHDLNIV
jgi:serine/threonine protein kinase